MEENNIIALLPDDTFRFSCTEEVPCFNECCKDLNQYLTPYDILRLKKRLGITSREFLKEYTVQHTGPESGLPVVTLKTENNSELKCPFVTPSGCSVYEDRPGSCRIYPIIRMLSRSRETGETKEQYYLLKEPHCLGFYQNKRQSVKEWIKSQNVEIYNEMNDLMLEIIALKNRYYPGVIDMKSGHLFYMACYDSDTFRTHFYENRLSDKMNLDDNTLNLIKFKL